jgi:CRP-like cAMP-binding protein
LDGIFIRGIDIRILPRFILSSQQIVYLKIYICIESFIIKLMHESLITYINSYASTPLTDSQAELIKNTFAPKKIRKRQYLLQEGEVCKYAAFIVKGAMRQYSVDDKGAEHIVRLLIENWWASDRESYVMLTPSVYNIDAWEDTDVLLVTKADFLNRISSIPAISELARKLDENYAISSQKRLNAIISLPAEKRYSDFTKTYPEFLQRFPQHILASYLGITKETLSRVRKHVK